MSKPNLPRFIYFTDKDAQYILCTEYPFVIGQVWKFTSEESKLEKVKTAFSKAAFASLKDYNVLVVLCGTLIGDSVKDELQTLDELKTFFLSRINEKPRAWDRYKIK